MNNHMIFVYFVRYYNSWIETSDEFAQSDTSSSFSSTPKTSESEKKVSLPQQFRKNSLDLTDDIEKFAPQVAEASADFSISYEVGITGIFLVVSGAEIWPHSEWNLGDFFFPILKKIPIFKKKTTTFFV